MSLVSMQKKFSSKLIVFGSAVFDDIGNHIASAVFEYVNIFFLLGFFFCYISLACKWSSLFWHLLGSGSESHLAVFIGF